MKKLTYLFILIPRLAFSQTSGITYQAVIYNPSGEKLPGYDNMYSPLTNQQICLHFSIIDQNGNLEYMEEATLMTDSFGMVNIVIGSHIQVDGYTSGFNGILWDGNPKSLKVDLDIKGECTMFEELSNQPFTYVPFALYSANSGNPGPQGEPGLDGQDGVGIASTVDNNNGTFTLNFTDGSSFTTVDLTGPQGAQGIQGEQGPTGPTGLTGPQGVQGPPGNDGVDGLDGTDGANGQDGVGIASTVDNNDGTFTLNFTDGSSFTTVDLTGPQGAQGIQGEQGPTGPTGLTGPQGVQGPPGNDGADGLNGTDGADGQDGVGIASTVDNNDGTFTLNFTDGSSFTTVDLTGPQGAQGIQGEQGPIGPTGLTGPQGVQGPPGNNGIDGLNGQDGADGLSAYDVWLSLGNTGTEQDFIDSLTGPSGNGIQSTTDNGDGTFTFDYTDGTSFTTIDLTGPEGPPGTDSSSSDNCITEISNDCITEISNISDVEMSQGDAANYCRDLTLNGYTDWRLPTLDEYMRLRSMINFPDSYYNGSIHTATYDYANYHAFFLIHELTLKTGRSNFSGTYYNAKCRCVR